MRNTTRQTIQKRVQQKRAWLIPPERNILIQSSKQLYPLTPKIKLQLNHIKGIDCKNFNHAVTPSAWSLQPPRPRSRHPDKTRNLNIDVLVEKLTSYYLLAVESARAKYVRIPPCALLVVQLLKDRRHVILSVWPKMSAAGFHMMNGLCVGYNTLLIASFHASISVACLPQTSICARTHC